MKTTRDVLAELQNRQIEIRFDGGQILLRPRTLVTAELAAGVRRNRPELVWLLERRLEPDPVFRPACEIWLSARTWDAWIMIEHKFWRNEDDDVDAA